MDHLFAISPRQNCKSTFYSYFTCYQTAGAEELGSHMNYKLYIKTLHITYIVRGNIIKTNNTT